MNPFEDEIRERLKANAADEPLRASAKAFTTKSVDAKYSYNFTWMGRPIIQYPQDIVAMQELIWRVQPDLIIETGIAHGGSLIFSASMLEVNAACGGPKDAEVLGIDIDIRPHNRDAILAHPMSRRVTMIEGSSVAPDIVGQVHARAARKQRVLVCLDSNHTHEHVLEELRAYAPLTSVNSYCIVFDTFIQDMPTETYRDRPWGQGDNPKTAVAAYLTEHPEFQIDCEIDNKLLISVAPEGYLKRVR